MSLQTDVADRESASLNAAAEKPSEPARATLLRIGLGFAAAQSLSVAAELGLADLLAAGPQTVEALASATGTEPSALRRLMRLLAAEGIFAEEASGTFAQTPLSDALRADASGSPRDFLRMIGREPFLAWGRLLDAVRTGRPSFELVFGAPRFDWLAQNPEAAALFQAAMVALGGDVIEPIATAYEFGDLGVVVDVGGGHGRLLSAILARHPGVEGILFDLPDGIAAAEAGLGGPLPRCKLVAGDFFESVPEGADAYLMKKVLARLVRRRRRPHPRQLPPRDGAGRPRPGCRDLVPPGNAPDPIKVMDVNMLVVTGGRERTADEFAALFARAGLAAGRVVPTGSRISIIEAFPA